MISVFLFPGNRNGIHRESTRTENYRDAVVQRLKIGEVEGFTDIDTESLLNLVVSSGNPFVDRGVVSNVSILSEEISLPLVSPFPVDLIGIVMGKQSLISSEVNYGHTKNRINGIVGSHGQVF